MSALIRSLRRGVGRFLLRGAVLRGWTGRKMLKLERRLREETVRAAGSPLPPETPSPFSPGASLPVRALAPLRRIVFIADVLWEMNELVPELEKFCPVEVLNLRPALRQSPGELPAVVTLRAVREFLAAPRDCEPDVVLFYANGSLLSEEVFAEIRRRWTCPLLGMNLDDKVSFWDYRLFSGGADNYLRWARFFDLNLTNSQIGADWYRQHGLPCLYSAQGVRHPAGMSEPTSADFRYGVTFLGVKKLDREAVVRRLRGEGIPVRTFGGGWPDSEWVADPNAVFRGSQINLGIGTATPHYTTIKGRDFECPGVGGCYLTTYNWELAQWWEIGQEILCYRNLEEAVEMIAYYQNRPEECLKIAQSAFRRAAREHTWAHRFRKIFKEVGLEAKA